MIVPGMTGRMTASLGATAMRTDDTTPATLLRRVDAALYQAEHTGELLSAAVSGDLGELDQQVGRR